MQYQWGVVHNTTLENTCGFYQHRCSLDKYSPCDEAAGTWMPGWCNILSQPEHLPCRENRMAYISIQEAKENVFSAHLRPEVLHTWLERILQSFQLWKKRWRIRKSLSWMSAHLTGELLKLAGPSNEQRPDHLQGLDPLFPISTSSSCAQGGVHLAQLLLQASSREYCHLYS